MTRERNADFRDYISNRFEEVLYEIIEDECNNFYVEFDIDDVELPSELNDKLTDACEKLMYVIKEIMVWQQLNGNGYATA